MSLLIINLLIWSSVKRSCCPHGLFTRQLPPSVANRGWGSERSHDTPVARHPLRSSRHLAIAARHPALSLSLHQGVPISPRTARRQTVAGELASQPECLSANPAPVCSAKLGQCAFPWQPRSNSHESSFFKGGLHPSAYLLTSTHSLQGAKRQ